MILESYYYNWCIQKATLSDITNALNSTDRIYEKDKDECHLMLKFLLKRGKVHLLKRADSVKWKDIFCMSYWDYSLQMYIVWVKKGYAKS